MGLEPRLSPKDRAVSHEAASCEPRDLLAAQPRVLSIWCPAESRGCCLPPDLAEAVARRCHHVTQRSGTRLRRWAPLLGPGPQDLLASPGELPSGGSAF